MVMLHKNLGQMWWSQASIGKHHDVEGRSAYFGNPQHRILKDNRYRNSNHRNYANMHMNIDCDINVCNSNIRTIVPTERV